MRLETTPASTRPASTRLGALGTPLAHAIMIGIVLASLIACSSDSSESAPAPDRAASKAELDAVFDEVWNQQLERSSYLRVRENLPVRSLDDLSYAAHQKDIEQARGWLQRLSAIDADALDHADWINARALTWDLDMMVEGDQWFWHAMTVTSYSSPMPIVTQVLASRPLTTEEERGEYLGLLGQVPAFVGQLEERVHCQAERGVRVWRDNLDPSVALMRSFAKGPASPFTPAPERLASLDAATRSSFSNQVATIITEQIDPRVNALADLLESEDYASKAPAAVGASQLPDGENYYRFLVRQMTTMNVAPEEIHQRGLALVTEMETRMTALREATGFKGSRDEFRQALRTDPKYFPKNADEVGQRLMDAAESMEEVVDQYFVGRPKQDYGVVRLDPSLEGSQTFGFYRPGTPGDPVGRYHYNGSNLNERSWLNLRGVSLHELIPGHHFHIARQAENTALPDYRRNMWHGAYTEGWGSYSSYLGLEVGIYAGDPLSEYGMYVLEVFLANRLVVDPGMNLLGWSLEQGRQFMRDHTLESERQIKTESLRYSADMPGQALAYQMGKLKFLELREKASRALGDRFDLRAFHEALLENGSLPMTVLEEHIDWWIAQQKDS